MIYGKRLETAAAKVFTGNPGFLQQPFDDIIANKFTNHILHHFAMLRYVKQESDEPGSWTRRFPRTGGFRSKMNGTDWEWLSPLLESLQKQTDETEEKEKDKGKENEMDTSTHMDEDGCPTVFARIIDKKTTSSFGFASSFESSDENDLYNADGMPSCFGQGVMKQRGVQHIPWCRSCLRSCYHQ